MKHLTFALAVISLVGLLGSALARTSQTSQSHNISLSDAQVSQVTNKRIIVTMRADGDLPGALTLALDLDGGDNRIVGGEWALVVSYIQDVNNGQTSRDGDSGGEILIQKGTLKGTISGGTVTLNADGKAVAVNSVQLNVNSGSLAFSDINNGNGFVYGSGLQDFSTSRGTLNLNF